jgi:hypothetical protein
MTPQTYIPLMVVSCGVVEWFLVIIVVLMVGLIVVVVDVIFVSVIKQNIHLILYDYARFV